MKNLLKRGFYDFTPRIRVQLIQVEAHASVYLIVFKLQVFGEPHFVQYYPKYRNHKDSHSEILSLLPHHLKMHPLACPGENVPLEEVQPQGS